MSGQAYPLDQFANVTLDGTGYGIARLGPTRVREHWQPIAVYVEVTTQVLEAQAELYVGSSLVPGQQFAQTGTGSSGDTCSMGGMDVRTGEFIIVEWKGGDVGAVATMRVRGTYTIGAPQT